MLSVCVKRLALAATTAAALGASAATTPAVAAPNQGNICAFVLHVARAQCDRLFGLRTTHRQASWIAPEAQSGSRLVYASQPIGDVVDVSTAGSSGLTPAGQIVLGQNSFPIGLGVDRSRRLYVTITALLGSPAVPSVEVFPPGKTQPSKIYTQGLSGPIDVAIDNGGTVYVADLEQHGGGGCASLSGDAQVVEYAKGSLTPTAVINDFPGCVDAVAVDPHLNLYLTYTYYPASGLAQSDVVEYAPGSTKGTHLGLSAPGGVFFEGVAVAPGGTLVVANNLDDDTLNQILSYVPGSTSPASSFEYGGLAPWPSQHFAFLDGRIFAPAYVAQNFGSVVAEFAYPSGKQLFAQDPTLVAPAFVYGFAASP